MVKQRSIGPDNLQDSDDDQAAFLDALRTKGMFRSHFSPQESTA